MDTAPVNPPSVPQIEQPGECSIGALFQRVLRHARASWLLPALFWKNIKFAFVSRRPGYWNELGRGLAARGRYEEALACYDHALAIRGHIPQIWTNRGRALRNLDRLDEAETSLREALRLKPDFASAHTELGFVLDYLGRFEEAEASVRAALRLQPENASLITDLATYSIVSGVRPKPRGAIARHCASDQRVLSGAGPLASRFCWPGSWRKVGMSGAGSRNA